MLTSRSGIDPSTLFPDFDIASRKAVLVAISGGGDSTALLLLLKSHLDRFAPATRLVAATVDHRLRPGSAAEADSVARLCARLGIEHRCLLWNAPKPATGLAAAAREARHDLLAGAARDQGTDLVLTAHTADDQAETVLMRQARDGGRGLAGIAPATLFCGTTWFARPLLSVRRRALRETLRESGTGWIEDPTNADPAYERARLREALAGPGGETRIEAALLAGAEAAAKRRAAGEAAASLIRGHATQAAPGLIRLDRKFAEEGEAATHVMRILLAVAGGTPQLPDAGRSAALVTRIAAGDAFRAVLSRCLVDARRSGVFLLREARGMPGRMPVGRGIVWDGRFHIDCASAGRLVEPFGTKRARRREAPDETCPASLARAALAAEPLILAWDHEAIAEPLEPHFTATPAPPRKGEGNPISGIPHLTADRTWPVRRSRKSPSPLWKGVRGGGSSTCDRAPDREPPDQTCVIERLVAPWARYLPSFDMAPAGAAAALVGVRAFPGPPFRRHNGNEA